MLLDRELDLAELSLAQKALMQLSPFGIGNEKPLFLFPNLSIASTRTFGKAQDHLEVAFEREGSRAAGISFFSTPESFTKKVSAGERADVVGHVELDWRGSPRIRVVDVL